MGTGHITEVAFGLDEFPGCERALRHIEYRLRGWGVEQSRITAGLARSDAEIIESDSRVYKLIEHFNQLRNCRSRAAANGRLA